MALQIKNIARSFTMQVKGKPVVLKDPGAHLTPDEVMKHYTGLYPELTNAHVDGPTVKGETAEYKFSTQAGTKG